MKSSHKQSRPTSYVYPHVSARAYAAMTSTERRKHGAKQAAASRAQEKLCEAYTVRFGVIPGALFLDTKTLRAMDASIRANVDKLIELRRENERKKKQADKAERKSLARERARWASTKAPLQEKAYTRLIKDRELYEGACNLLWQEYFEYRDAHPTCEPLTASDLAYAGQWTTCARRVGCA